MVLTRVKIMGMKKDIKKDMMMEKKGTKKTFLLK